MSKTQQKAAESRVKVAKAVLVKIREGKTNLAMTLAKPELICFPPAMKTPAEEVYKELVDMEIQCKAVEADGTKELPDGITAAKDR